MWRGMRWPSAGWMSPRDTVGLACQRMTRRGGGHVQGRLTSSACCLVRESCVHVRCLFLCVFCGVFHALELCL